MLSLQQHNTRMRPTFSVLDTKPSHILDFPLTVQQQLWLLFLLPTIWLILLFIADIATDIAVGVELINEGHYFAGILTLLFIVLPSLLSYFFRLSEPPDTKEVKVAFTWLSVETAAFLLFPIRPLHCFAERLFWSIEAIRLEDPEREEALREFEDTRVFVIENYLFTQAFLQSGPQAILQISLLVLGTSKHSSTEAVQVICLMTSLASLAWIAASYQRYETQVRGGRQQVWSSNDRSLTTLLNLSELDVNSQQQRSTGIKIMEEDNPIGSILLFTFWYFFLFGRILCLVIAFSFFPWAVLGVCLAHYLFNLAYILPTPRLSTLIPVKLILAFVYIFCLVEVRIQFRKSYLFYSLFFFFTIIENVSLTILWVFWAKWTGGWYYYYLYSIGISHGMATLFIVIYLKFFKPKIRRIQVN
ncbi:XK-related protein 6 isoform X2 [Halyomorpha halys]|uniref:XK-related protein 6 isoform X2 n=1 Tax=Halyomorpha halys TaxID=286706 RepID=UPI0034D38BD3